MKILNATQAVLVIPIDGDSTISIKPGQLSEPFTASKNTISAAIKSITPKEIGIIYYSIQEFGIAQTVCNIMPYLYSSEEEATNILLIDHKNIITIENEIKELEKRISNIEKNISTTNSCWKSIKNIFRKNKKNN